MLRRIEAHKSKLVDDDNGEGSPNNESNWRLRTNGWKTVRKDQRRPTLRQSMQTIRERNRTNGGRIIKLQRTGLRIICQNGQLRNKID